MANALHRYINAKRLRGAGSVAAAVGNAGGNPKVQQSAAATTVNASTNTKPENVGAKVSNEIIQAGGTPAQAAAGAGSAAKQHSQTQGKSPTVALAVGETAAAEAAVQHTNTPSGAAAAAATGANAANLNANRAAKLAVLLNLIGNLNAQNNTWYSGQNLTALNTRLNNAAKNMNLNQNTINKLRTVKNRIKKAMNAKASIHANGNNKYGNSKRTNPIKALRTIQLASIIGYSRSNNARTPPYIAEALARLKKNTTSANNKEKLRESLLRAKTNYGVWNIPPLN